MKFKKGLNLVSGENTRLAITHIEFFKDERVLVIDKNQLILGNYKVYKFDCIIFSNIIDVIEETYKNIDTFVFNLPESSITLKQQSELCFIISYLVSLGKKIIIITNSDFILREFNILCFNFTTKVNLVDEVNRIEYEEKIPTGYLQLDPKNVRYYEYDYYTKKMFNLVRKDRGFLKPTFILQQLDNQNTRHRKCKI